MVTGFWDLHMMVTIAVDIPNVQTNTHTEDSWDGLFHNTATDVPRISFEIGGMSKTYLVLLLYHCTRKVLPTQIRENPIDLKVLTYYSENKGASWKSVGI